MPREHIYTLQIQPDWHIILSNHLAASPKVPLAHQSELDVEGGFGDAVVRLALPTNKNPLLSRVWLNITRISPENTQDTMFQHININELTDQSDVDRVVLSSEAVDVGSVKYEEMVEERSAKNSQKSTKSSSNSIKSTQKSISITLHKSLPSRLIIQTVVSSPVGEYPYIHKVVNDSRRQKKAQNDMNDPNNLRLRPGDLDSDDEFGTMYDGDEKSGLDKEKEIAKRVAIAEKKIDQSLQEIDEMGHLLLSKRPTDIPIVSAVDINPVDCDLVISGAERGDLKVWNCTNGKTLFFDPSPHSQSTTNPPSNSHLGDITSVQWLHNGIMALSSSSDCTVKLWLLNTTNSSSRCIKTFVGHNRGVIQALQHPTQRNRIVSIGKDGKLMVFNIAMNPKEAFCGPEIEFSVLSGPEVNDFEQSLVSFVFVGGGNDHSNNTNNNETTMTTSTASPSTPSPQSDYIIVCSTIGVHIIDISAKPAQNGANDKDGKILYRNDKISSSTIYNNNLYLGTSTGSIIVLPLESLISGRFIDGKSSGVGPDSTPNGDNIVTDDGPDADAHLNQNNQNNKNTTNDDSTTTSMVSIEQPEGAIPRPLHPPSPLEYTLFDEAITAMKWFNGELVVTTFQGDCTIMNKDFSLQTHLFSGTDQPLRAFDVKFNSKINKAVIIAGGDDGLLQWRF